VRTDHAGGRAARDEQGAHACADRRSHERQSLPLRDVRTHRARHPARREGGVAMAITPRITRRQLIAGSAGLTLAFVIDRGRGGLLVTAASRSTPAYWLPLRTAGAQARRVLLDAVAEKWSVPVGELTTEPSTVVHKASNRRISYGDVAAFAKAPAELPKIAP